MALSCFSSSCLAHMGLLPEPRRLGTRRKLVRAGLDIVDLRHQAGWHCLSRQLYIVRPAFFRATPLWRMHGRRKAKPAANRECNARRRKRRERMGTNCTRPLHCQRQPGHGRRPNEPWTPFAAGIHPRTLHERLSTLGGGSCDEFLGRLHVRCVYHANGQMCVPLRRRESKSCGILGHRCRQLGAVTRPYPLHSPRKSTPLHSPRLTECCSMLGAGSGRLRSLLRRRGCSNTEKARENGLYPEVQHCFRCPSARCR